MATDAEHFGGGTFAVRLERAAMSRDWKFCPYSGALLEMEPAKGIATCSVSGYTRNLSGTDNHHRSNRDLSHRV